jgi:SRSO17 transposase
MKPPYHSTPEPAGTSLAQIAGWPVRLQQVHARLRPCFARPEPYQLALLYLQAVLSEIPRKNGWQIAEHARQLRPYGIQRLLSRAVWDQDGVRDELRALVTETLQPPPVLPESAESEELFPVLALDESAIPKRGKHSAGVGPQYCGLTGRVEN